MNSYMMHFAVYIFAMVGVICFALFVVKKSITNSFKKNNSGFLQVEDSITFAPKKSLLVIKAGEKKLLIASDEGRTTFLTELTDKEQDINALGQLNLGSKLTSANMYKEPEFMKKTKSPVMRELLGKLK